MRLVDADAHVIEPRGLWRDGVDPAWRGQAPVHVPREADPAGALSWTVDTALLAEAHLACARAGIDPSELPARLGDREPALRTLEWDGRPVWDGVPAGAWTRGALTTVAHHLDALLAGFDADSYVSRLSAMGVERAHLYPTAGLWVLAIERMPAELAAQLARAYNDWLRAFVAPTAGFLRPVGVLALHDPEAMVSEAERVASWGWTAVMIRPNPYGGRTLAHPALEPFWTACERLGLAVSVHEGSHARVASTGADRFGTRFGRHACSHPMEQMMALLALIEGGVLDRHPGLRVGFLEAGCGWLPSWLWRLDHLEYDNLAWEVRDTVRMRPSDYFRRQCFIGCEPEEPGIEEVVDRFGVGCLLYGSDYPHIDHTPRIRKDVAVLVERLGEAAAGAVLWDNPNRYYGVSG